MVKLKTDSEHVYVKKKKKNDGAFSRAILISNIHPLGSNVWPMCSLFCLCLVSLAVLKLTNYTISQVSEHRKGAQGMCALRAPHEHNKGRKTCLVVRKGVDLTDIQNVKQSTVWWTQKYYHSPVFSSENSWHVGEHDNGFGQGQELNVADWFDVPLTLLDVREFMIVPRFCRLSAPLYCTHIPSHKLVHALWSRCTCSVLYMHDTCTFPHSAQLQVLSWLVLRLCGGEVILQEALQVLKGRPLLRLFSPAGQHQVMQGFRALCWARHPIATLHLV